MEFVLSCKLRTACGQHEFKFQQDFKIEDLAIGFQTYLSGSSTYLIGADIGVLKHNVMFFNKEYGGYWYTYVGAETTIKGGLDVELLSLNGTKSLLIGLHKNGSYSLAILSLLIIKNEKLS
jgi:hypothetical protein